MADGDKDKKNEDLEEGALEEAEAELKKVEKEYSAPSVEEQAALDQAAKEAQKKAAADAAKEAGNTSDLSDSEKRLLDIKEGKTPPLYSNKKDGGRKR